MKRSCQHFKGPRRVGGSANYVTSWSATTLRTLGDLNVIDLLPLGDRSIEIVPQGVGKTNILFLDEANATIMDLNVLVTKTRSDYTDYVESHDKAKIPAPLPTGHTSSIGEAPGGDHLTSLDSVSTSAR